MKRSHKPGPRLFAEPETPAARLEGAYFANIDGAARGNPGPASYGVVLRRPDGSPLESLGKYIGRATNNVAEYYALIAALDYAAANGVRRLRVGSDSQLIVNQMKGLYKVKDAGLKPLHERARKQAAALESFSIQYVPREQNREADSLANAALDATSGGSAAGRTSQSSTPDHFSGKTLAAGDLKGEQKYGLSKKRIRARFRAGALHPAAPLDLHEGEEVEIIIERRTR